MKKSPFFSIIIPTLNEEKNLPQLLADITQQNSKDFEVFVVDARSKDKTQDIAKNYEKKFSNFHLIVSQKRGVSRQRNLGAKNAQGKYVLFLDADDRIPPFFLEKLSTHCTEKDVDSFSTYADADTDLARDKVFINFMNTLFEAASIVKKPLVVGACIGCKRSVFSLTKGFNEQINYMEDTEFIRRVADAGYSFKFFREPTYVYSLRRFRKEGMIRFYTKLAPISIKSLVQGKIIGEVPEYPMLGGAYFDTKEELKAKKMNRSRQRMKEWLDFMKETISS